MDSSTKKKALAQKIIDRLSELDLDRQQFAYLMRVRPSCVTKWLKGDHNFTLKTLYEIERVLELPLIDYCITPIGIPEDKYLGWV